MTRRIRRALAGTMAVASCATLGAVGATSASAQTCPNASTSTVSGTPSYTYTRGCMISFDGTPIVYNLFEPLNPGPHSLYTILQGPGWGGAGDTSPDSALIAHGYGELTWDPRGFGQSGGVAEVDSPASEGRDVSALIDKVLTGRPEIAIDDGDGSQPHYFNDHGQHNSFGQPVVGMAGGSYGGGIQLSTAAFDDRIKAMAPALAWNNLDYSLYPGNVIKLGWDELLFGAGLAEGGAAHIQGDVGSAPALGGDGGVQTGGFDPNIYYSETTGTALGYPDRQTTAWFAQRSMAVWGAGPAGHLPDIPTLMIQGTVDTLFNLNDAWANEQQITAARPHLPVKLIAFCGGHVSCPTGAPPAGSNYSDTASKSSPVGAGQSAGTFTENQTIAWFDHYLRGEGSSDGMPANVVYQDQNGDYHGISTFPTAAGPGPAGYVSAPFSGTLVSHGVPSGAGPAGLDTAVTDGATNANDPGQVTVPVLTAPAHADVPIVGEGHVNATVTVNGSATNLFFRLVDKSTGGVVDLQTSSQRFDNLDLQDNATNPTLPPTPQQVSLDLSGVAYDLPAGDTLELQVSTSSNAYVPNRGSAVVTVANGTVAVPTLAPQG
jgi:ABC-2 type transport system ATP-binding protein